MPGVKDNFEIYNIPKFIPEHAGRPQPEVVRRHWAEIESFSKRIHDGIVRKLLVVFAVALGLNDEEWFVNRHRYEKSSGDHLRYMKYYKRSEEENQKLGGVWLKGLVHDTTWLDDTCLVLILFSSFLSHSDMGSLTLLFRQPVAALQVLTKEGDWKWVKPQSDALTVNIADALQFLTSKPSVPIYMIDYVQLTPLQTAISSRAFTGSSRLPGIRRTLTGLACCTWSGSKTILNSCRSRSPRYWLVAGSLRSKSS